MSGQSGSVIAVVAVKTAVNDVRVLDELLKAAKQPSPVMFPGQSKKLKLNVLPGITNGNEVC
jgi:hypothetical protein